jgi:tetratricopeptide (TPR) repeat protein
VDGVAPKKRERRPIVLLDADGQSPAELIESGRVALAAGDCRGAVQAWRRAHVILAARNARDSRLEAALAEAHFRCGILARPVNLDDLTEAMRFKPDEPRYHYHWALARQRRGEIEMAIPVYRALLERTPPYRRAAFPLAVALLTAGKQPSKDKVWGFLSSEERERLANAYTVLKGRPRAVWRSSPLLDADALWAGLAAFRMGHPSAGSLLQAALDDPALPHLAAAVARYYLGVLAWAERRHSDALGHWQAAHAAGLRSEWLSRNLANAYKRAALTLLETPRMELPQLPASPSPGVPASEQAVRADASLAILAEVLHLAERGLEHQPDDPYLVEIANHARAQLGYCAARANNWADAAGYLWAAADSGDRRRATLTNAALTAEALNRFARAADLWQRVLRYRTHRPGTTNSLSQEQVARLWQRVGDCYERAGDYEEAARAYRNAVRNQPEAVEVRLGLAQVLVKAERYSAALSAIDEVLAIRPGHVPALALQAQTLEKGGYLYAALQTWQRVLDLDPEHATVRQNLARLHRIEGDYQRDSGDLRRAIIAYRDGLRYKPSDARLRASLALACGLQGRTETALRELEALVREQPGDSEAAYWVLDAYLRLAAWDRAAALIQQIQHADTLPPPDQLVDLAYLCLRCGRSEWASQLLELVERQCDDIGALMDVVNAYQEAGQNVEAMRVIRRVIDLQPDNAEAHVMLGLQLLGAGDDPAAAEEHLQRAEQLARRTNDAVVLLQARVGLNLIRSGGRE